MDCPRCNGEGSVCDYCGAGIVSQGGETLSRICTACGGEFCAGLPEELKVRGAKDCFAQHTCAKG